MMYSTRRIATNGDNLTQVSQADAGLPGARADIGSHLHPDLQTYTRANAEIQMDAVHWA